MLVMCCTRKKIPEKVKKDKVNSFFCLTSRKSLVTDVSVRGLPAGYIYYLRDAFSGLMTIMLVIQQEHVDITLALCSGSL